MTRPARDALRHVDPSPPKRAFPRCPPLSAKPFAVLAGVAMSVALAGCNDSQTRSPNQQAASQELKAAGQNLKAAAVETGVAAKVAAKDAEPELHRLGKAADRGLANLSDATGTAAAKAGHALDRAGEKTDAAAHRAAADARAHADQTRN